MRIIKSLKFAEDFDPRLDQFDDDTVAKMNQIEQDKVNPPVAGETPITKDLPVTKDDYENVLVDNLINEDGEEDVLTEEAPVDIGVSPEEQNLIPDEDNIPEFTSTIQALEWARDNNRVVKIDYTTKGKGSRNEKKYLKREKGLTRTPLGGVNIFRTVEPYYIFKAGNGNTILVTYDRSVGRGFIGKRNPSDNIRAFIIENISKYEFVKNRKTKKPQYFDPKFKVNLNSNKTVDKGIDKMENINDSLIEVGAALKAKGLVKSASVIKSAEKVLKSTKTAQYVGVQGYWLRNRRCWDNCYRQKRTTQPESPAQEVWMQCWDEYKESINDNKSGWEKYAKQEKSPKIGLKKTAQLHKKFANQVFKKVKSGMSTPEAVYTIIEKEVDAQKNKILESSSQLMDIAYTLANSGEKDLGEKLAGISAEVLKEADFTGNQKKEATWWNPWSWGEKGQGKEQNREVNDWLETIRDQCNALVQKLQGFMGQQATAASNKSIIIEAGKEMVIAKTPSKNPFPINKKPQITPDQAGYEFDQLQQKGYDQDEAKQYNKGWDQQNAAEQYNKGWDQQNAAEQDNAMYNMGNKAGQPQQPSAPQVSPEHMQEYMGVFEQANDALSVFGSFAGKNNPNAQQLLQPAISNITNIIQKHNQMANTGQFDIAQMIGNLQSLGQATMQAQQRVDQASGGDQAGGNPSGAVSSNPAGAVGGDPAGAVGGDPSGAVAPGGKLPQTPADQQTTPTPKPDPYSQESIGQLTLDQLNIIKPLVDAQLAIKQKQSPLMN
jgi:hypothetical protein